jgi:hypothetical protein
MEVHLGLQWRFSRGQSSLETNILRQCNSTQENSHGWSGRRLIIFCFMYQHNTRDKITLILEMPLASRISRWVQHIFMIQTQSPWIPLKQHALLGNQLPRQFAGTQHWWDYLKGFAIWFIWLHRNAVDFQSTEVRLQQSLGPTLAGSVLVLPPVPALSMLQ